MDGPTTDLDLRNSFAVVKNILIERPDRDEIRHRQSRLSQLEHQYET